MADRDAAARSRLGERLADMFSMDLFGASSTGESPSGGGGPNGDDDAADAREADGVGGGGAFEFRLFSTGGAATVVLDPEEDGADEGGEGGIASARPASFYLRGELSPEECSRFRRAAVGYGDVLRAAGQRAWGLEVPWKVTHITVKSGRGPGNAPAEVQVSDGKVQCAAEDPRRRKRPGKKRRIALRTKEKARREREEMLEKKKVTKEEHLREKKKRLNREKKLKRKKKEKEKKLVTKEETGAGVKGDASSTGSDTVE